MFSLCISSCRKWYNGKISSEHKENCSKKAVFDNRGSVLHNITLKDDISFTNAPANMIHQYQLKVKGISTRLLPDHCKNHFISKIGNRVWVKAPHGRCTSRYQVGRVMDVVSPQIIIVDGMPRHVEDLHLFIDSDTAMCKSDDDSSSESDQIIEICESDASTDADSGNSRLCLMSLQGMTLQCM